MSFGKIQAERSITLLAGAVFFAWLVYRIALIFFQHPDAGGAEGNIVYFIQRLLDGQPLYTDPETAPYAVAQYSPLYYYIVAGVARLAGINADDILPVFITGRIIGLVFNLGFIFIVYLAARNIFAVSRGRSLTAAFLSFILLEITSFARPDSLYHLFFMLSLYFFMLSQKEGDNERPTENGRIIISGVLAAFALFSKQSGIVLPVILAGWMLWEKKYRQLFLFVCYYAITACLFIACIWLVNGLDMFYKNVVQGVDNGISPGWFRAVILPDFYLRYGLILVPVFVVLLLLLKRETKTVLRFSLFATILLFVLANGLAIKNGSNPGYFTEWWTMVFILIVYYWERHPSPAVMWIYISIISLVLVLKGIEIVKPLEEKLDALGDKDLYTAYVRDRPIADKILNNLGKESKYIVFLNFNTAESYLSNMLFRHAVMPQMDIVALAAYPRKKYDYSLFEREALGGQFTWMLMKEGGPQKQFFNLMLDKYQLKETISGFTVYQVGP